MAPEGTNEATSEGTGEPATQPLRVGPHIARHTRPQLDPLPASGGLPGTAPRPRAVRVLGGVAAVGVLLLPQIFVPVAFLGALSPLSDTSSGASVVLYVVVSLAVSLAAVPLLPQVSYRRRDALVLLAVPIWQWVLAFRLGYRLAFLPYRDWQPRPDEMVTARRIRGARLWVRPGA